jgi:hypothetical protein
VKRSFVKNAKAENFAQDVIPKTFGGITMKHIKKIDL